MSDFLCLVWKVEHGSAAFLKTPNDKTIMFDAGSSDDFSPAKHLSGQYNLNSINNKLDKLIISHADRDHISDLPYVYSLLKPRILSRNKAVSSDVLYPEGTTDLKDPLLTYKLMDDIYIHPISQSDQSTPISNWGDVFVEEFHCSPEQLKDCPEGSLRNNLSALSYVRCGDLEVVFPGDLEPLGWDALIENTQIGQYVGQAKVRILIASHHGRSSGIRIGEEVYERFLNMMKPHIVIISDKWGNETTDPEAYKPYALGYSVYSNEEKKSENTQILTTKSNKCVGLFVMSGVPFVVAY
jgi:competence protein ComEC